MRWGTGRATAGSPRACSSTPRGPSGRWLRPCPALRVSGSACLPQLHPLFEFLRLAAFVVSVGHIAFVLATMLVHAGAIFVVFLAIPLVAVLAQMGRRQLALQGLRGLQAISRLRRVDWQSIPSEMRADETQEPRPEDHDRRNAETSEEHDGANESTHDRSQSHASPRKQDAEGTSVDASTRNQRAEARDSVQDAKDRGGVRTEGGPDRQRPARDGEQERAHPEDLTHPRGPSEDAGEHGAF